MEEIEYSSTLENLFRNTKGGCIDTGKFLTQLSDILSRRKQGIADVGFDVYMCRKDGKFRTLVMRKCFDADENFIQWMFDKCGISGWDVFKTEIGGWSRATGTSKVRFAYDIYVDMRK